MQQVVIIVFLFCVGICRGQSPILPLINNTGYGDINDAYYKDLGNDLNVFEGTWLYVNGGTSLTIKLQKKTMQLYSDANKTFYEDILIGEYKFILNGVEKINTLPLIDLNINPYAHNIVGNAVVGPTDRRVYTQFSDPMRQIQGMDQQMIFRRADVGAIQKLKLVFRMTEAPVTVDGQQQSPYSSYTLPFGEYILTKQP